MMSSCLKRNSLLLAAVASALLIPALAQQRTVQNPAPIPAAKTQVTIQSVEPNPVVLIAGGHEVQATVSGSNLGQVTAVQAMDGGKPAGDFECKLGPASASTRVVNLKAKAEAKPGRYVLRIVTRSQRIDIPERTASIEVKAGSAVAATTVTNKQTAQVSPSAGQSASRPKTTSRPALPEPTSRTLSSADLNSVAAQVFKGAYLRANACGGQDSERKTTINVPNAYFKQEPLSRMSYELTDGEKDRCHLGDYYRRSKIRACVDQCDTASWAGSVEKGKFKVVITFSNILVIKTRSIDEDRGAGLGVVWKDSPGDWSDPKADENIPDYRLSGSLEVFLAPQAEGGALAYSAVDVRWSFYQPLTGWIRLPGGTHLPDQVNRFICHEVEQPKILAYKDSVLETVRQRVLAVFSDGQVRVRLSDVLTRHVLSGRYADRTIAGVSGKGDKIEVAFQ